MFIPSLTRALLQAIQLASLQHSPYLCRAVPKVLSSAAKVRWSSQSSHYVPASLLASQTGHWGLTLVFLQSLLEMYSAYWSRMHSAVFSVVCLRAGHVIVSKVCVSSLHLLTFECKKLIKAILQTCILQTSPELWSCCHISTNSSKKWISKWVDW